MKSVFLAIKIPLQFIELVYTSISHPSVSHLDSSQPPRIMLRRTLPHPEKPTDRTLQLRRSIALV